VNYTPSEFNGFEMAEWEGRTCWDS